MSKMSHADTFGGTDPDVALIRRDMARTTDVWNPAFKLTDTKSSNLTTSVTLAKRTRGNKGDLHRVSSNKVTTFQFTG
jgi:hypothetical protein